MHYYTLLIFAAIVALSRSFSYPDYGKTQSVAADGELLCNGSPVAYAKIRLYHRGIIFETELARGRSGSNGNFYIHGSKIFGNFDPKLNIYHKCNRSGKCYRKFSIKIPASYVTKGRYPKKVFHLGVKDLAKKQPGESIECIN